MREIVADTGVIAYCGLYCGACGRYRKEKCPGCHENSKASWCKVRSCCIENSYSTCADCKEFSNPKDCKKFNNFMSKLFGFIFNSDRAACIDCIKQTGLQAFAEKMTLEKRISIKR